MFPLEFPLGILKRNARKGQTILDPFCGRGTTNFAARLLGLQSLGVDSSPVAFAISSAKLVAPNPEAVVDEARSIIADASSARVPEGDFWRLAYDESVLLKLCLIRDALAVDCTTPERIALRGIILGALHGPRQKVLLSYFSNQSPRTYGPKPAYAVRYWTERGMTPPKVDVLELVERKATRLYQPALAALGSARHADSRHVSALEPSSPQGKFDWVITSPPYYGMKTYISDQWLRNWFVGGPATVDYKTAQQLTHAAPADFSRDLATVMNNSAQECREGARLVMRFGGISVRNVDPKQLAVESLKATPWRIDRIKSAGTATSGKRQADNFLKSKSSPMTEYDIWATLN